MTRLRLEYKWLVGIVFTLAMFMDLLDMTVTNVAIPTLAREFSASTTTIEWVITGYLLSLAMFIPISGWLGDRFGTKLIFMAALTVFTLGSLLCGIAWDVESLIAFRVVQGIGGGMLTPVGMTMLFRAFPPSERAAASAILALPTTVAPALGPILGGYLVDYQSWRWIFFINIPVGIIAMVATIALIREEKQHTAGHLDLPGFILSGAGLIAIVYGLAEAGQHGFGDAAVLPYLLAGVVLLTVFTIVELRTESPMLDVRLLRDKLFGASSVVMLIGNASIMGSFFLIPIFLQTQKGVSAFDTGLISLPLPLGVALMAQPAAKFYPKIGPKRMMIIAFLGNALLTMVFALVGYDTSSWLIAGSMFVRGFFFAFLFIPMQAATFATISPAATGRASSIFSVVRQVAASLGVAILATALTTRLDSHHAILGDAATRVGALAAFHDAFIFAGALSIFGVIACLWIDDEKAIQATAAQGAFSGEGEFALVEASAADGGFV